MAGKLKIKRNGGCLPTLSLLAMLLLGGVLAWLSLVGLPDSALRSLEREAAAAGVPVKVGAIKLSPGSGLALKVENVSLAVPQADAPDATLKARKVKVRFSLMNLLAGDLIPTSLYMRAAEATVPLSRNGEEVFKALELDLQGAYNARDERLDLRGSTTAQGIDLEVHAFLPEEMLTAESPEQSTEPLDLPKLLAGARPKLEQAYREIDAQHWRNAPSIFLAVDCLDKGSPVVLIFANMESYEYGGYHFRKLSVDANYHEDILLVNSMRFRTVNPDAEVEFKGGYDMDHRLLDFQLKSNAPLLLMLRDVLGNDAPAALRAFTHARETSPHIELEGQAEFTDDFALNSISARGSLEIGECAFNDSSINRAFLSFFYDNGNFNLSELSIDFPDGELRASGSITQELGHARVDITMPEPSLKKLLGNLYGEPVSMPEDIKTEGVIHLAAETDMGTKPFIPGKTRLKEMVPTLHSVKLVLEPERLTFCGTALTRPSLRLGVGGTSLGMEKPEVIEAKSVTLDFSADAVETQHADTPISAVKPALSVALQDVRLSPDDIEAGTAQHIDVKLGAESATSPHGTLRGVALHADTPNVSKDWSKSIADSRVLLHIDEIKNDNGTAGGIDLKAEIESDRNGTASLAMDVDGRHFSTGVEVTQMPNDSLLLTVQNADVPLAALAPFIFPNGAPAAEDIKLPGQVLLSGHARLDLGTQTLGAGGFHLHVPELVRISHTVPALRGTETRLAVTLDAEWQLNEARDILYNASAVITAPTGNMAVDLEGDLARSVRITGKSDIRPDTFDALIDDIDAHSILCDFRYTENSKVVADNIDTTIDYSNGTRVLSHCNATLHNLDYMTGSIVAEQNEDGTPTGKERVRTDLPDKDPLTAIKKAACAVNVDLLLGARDAAGQPVPDRQLVNLSGITLEYDNRPWQKRRGFNGGPAESTFTCSSILFDLETNRMDLENGSGCVYPAYAFGTFFPPLQEFMKDITAPEPVQVDSKHCVFPLAKRSQAPILGTIRVSANKPCTYHFLGTDLQLDRFSSFLDLSNDFLTIDRLNGKFYGGALDGTIKIGISGETTSVDGYVTVSCADLKKLAQAFNKEFKPAICSGNIRFQSPSTELNALQAYGEFSIKDGDLMQLGIFSPISDFISDIPGHLFKMKKGVDGQTAPTKPGLAHRAATAVFSSPKKIIKGIGDTAERLPFVSHFTAYDIQDAYLSYIIKDGHMRSRTMKAMGANLSVRANVDLNLDDLSISGDMWPTLTSVPALALTPITFLSRFIVDIHLGGTLKDLKWSFGLKEVKKDAKTGQTPKTQTAQP